MPHRFIISGGGTGGHIFPAIAIANTIKQREPEADILFVGAKGKMEMEKVPAAGYKIVGLNISGIRRSLSLSNLLVPIKLLNALSQAFKILRDFKPDVVVGVGGFASGALVFAASVKGIPTLIQEQNSFPGVTNRILSRRVKAICVAYPDMEKHFPKAKLVITGNPVRSEIYASNPEQVASRAHFGLSADRFTVLAVGGSLGARSINEAMAKNISQFASHNIQIIWQTGKGHLSQAEAAVDAASKDRVCVQEFIARMDLAYAAADVVVSRAGAIAVSELCVVKKPCILVPYPFAAEDHQTSNAKVLSHVKAAVLLPDHEVREKLGDSVLNLKNDENLRIEMSANIGKLAKPDAANRITDEVFKLIPSKA
jgi:UDP-N-acetylglucosamine--N-acetylmuramyl-(pentapeptide) pyrophosphoryl-undecaprenol N-acetylglucosamine transferase